MIVKKRCSDSLNTESESSEQQCPRLVVNGTEHIGQKNILSTLSELNKTTRFETPGTNSQLEVVLVANIPSLALESGYKIYLIDNPGLGELNQLATRLAELAVATSAAYIYTMDCENIELNEHAEVLKVLLEKDHDLLQSGRLVMAVTKCDRFYERENALSGSEEQNRIKELVCETFESSLHVPVPYDNVKPVSGKWQSWIARYESLDPRTRGKADTSAKDYTELMDDCEKPKDKLAALKHGSNYAFLEEKITSLVQDCVGFFETKMKTGTLSALEWAVKHINSYKDALEKEINDRTENLRKIHQTFDEMKQSDQDIAKALDSDHVSRMEASLSAAFKIDIEQVRQEMFKDAREKYTQFETVCKQKQRNGYIVREFLTDFKTFLLDMNSQVMLKIRKQQYRTMYELYFGVHKSLVNTFQELNKAASLVCHRDYEKTDIRDESTSCQEQLIVLSYDQISTLLVANQNIQRCNPQDTLNALICLRGLAALFRTRNSDGIFDDTAFPAISEEAVEEEAIFTHRLKSREVVSLLNVNKRIVEGELQSFLDAIESQFVGYFSNKFANHGKAYLRDCIANWKDHLTAARKDAESQTKEKVVLLKSLQKVSDLSDCIQSLIQNISTHL